MTEHRCIRCNTPVELPDGSPGVLCPKCNTAVMPEDFEERARPVYVSPSILILLAVSIIVLVLVAGMWLYLGPLAPEATLTFNGEPRAASGAPRRFTLWELHSDDTVRVVDIVTSPQSQGATCSVCGVSLWDKDDVISQRWIGGSVRDERTTEEVWRGETYVRTCYMVKISDGNYYGFDMRFQRLPHVHIQQARRLFNLGLDPLEGWTQEIVAVAIPVDARIERVYDYQPYRHMVVDDWDVLYYDVTSTTSHVTLSTNYISGDDAPSLDPFYLEANR